MGNILSAIRDDMHEYEGLCKEYGEKVQYSLDAYGNSLVDCYGKHAKKLITRHRKESLKKWQKKLKERN